VTGNLLTATDPLTHATAIAYNTFGQPISVTDALNQTTTFDYDSVGNLIATADPLGNRTLRFYDAASRLIAVTDPRGKTTQFTYDALNRVTQIQDAINGITSFTYDPNGNLLTVTDAKNQTTTYTYDIMDRLLTRTDALNRTERYEYDLAGNLTKFTDRKNQVATFAYDALNRRINATYADGSVATFTYDTVGRMTKAADTAPGAGTIDFAYDILDRLIQETTGQGVVSYQYDVLGRRTQMTANGQQPTTYQYDAASRLTRVAQGALFAALGYDNANRRTSLGYSNGTTTSYAYDLASRLTNIMHNGPSGIIDALTYTYDAAGNRSRVLRTNGTATLLPDPVAAATYDAANEQTMFDALNVTYDQNGNLSNDGVNTYQLDSRNRLVGISGGVTASFNYDALGRRVNKTVNNQASQFLYDGNDIVAEADNGLVVANYLRSLNIDEPFVRQGTSNEFYHPDALGSTVALTSTAAAKIASYTYEGFGRTTATGTSSNPFQYTGRENDGIGLYYYRARFYGPTFGRFITEDPLYSPLFRTPKKCVTFGPDVTNYIESGDSSLASLMMFRFYRISKNAFTMNPQKLSPYTYAENNPVNKFDPMGLISGPQNLGCDKVPDFLEGRCTVQCCNEHDNCYERQRSFCSMTSWLDVGARFTRPDCLSCNRAVVQCISRNIFKGRKNVCDLTDF
jgi:RHS repeat-associated protein